MPGARRPQAGYNVILASTQQAEAHSTELLDLEKRTILPKSATRNPSNIGPVLFYCSINAVLSASLIAFNKYLMHESRFPYPVPLVAMHSSASSLFVGLFLVLQRGCSTGESGLFAALPQALTDTSIKPKVFCLAALFAVQLVFSNAAFMYSSVVFIQMLKEGNLAFVYALSVLAALEVVHWQRIRVLILIIFFTLLTIKGSLHFSWQGFLIQLVGQTFEGFRIVLQALMLANLDILTYMILVMPACSIILGGFMTFNACVWQVGAAAAPNMSMIVAWWPQLLANALLAVALNFATALVVKHASAMGLVLSGVMKDTAIVCAGAYFLGESITSVQVFGFSMQIACVLAYSLIKLYPEKFNDGIPLGLKRIVGIEDDTCVALSVAVGAKQPYGAAAQK